MIEIDGNHGWSNFAGNTTARRARERCGQVLCGIDEEKPAAGAPTDSGNGESYASSRVPTLQFTKLGHKAIRKG